MLAIHGLQAVLILSVLALVAGRVRVLLYQAPAGERFVGALRRACEGGDPARARQLAHAMAPAWCARVADAGLSADTGGVEAMQEELLEVRAAALHRLRTLRVCATVASTLGLLGAILALAYGFGGSGLLALQAGLSERLALQRALVTMGIGVGTSAFCFYAFGLFRRAALQLISQSVQTARAVETLLT